MRIRSCAPAPRVEMHMTSMIDVVFQLLIFFVLSFRIQIDEGDLSLKMPAETAVVAPAFDSQVPLAVHLRAGEGGALASITVNGEPLADPPALRAHVEQLLEVHEPFPFDLMCDATLRYQHVMAALTAVSGKRDGDRIVSLAQDVRLRTRP